MEAVCRRFLLSNHFLTEDGADASKKAELGPLPLGAKLLLSGIGAAWAGIFAAPIVSCCEKKKKKPLDYLDFYVIRELL